VRRGWRRRGVAAALLAAAVRFARRAGAPALEAYPAVPGRTKNLYTGTLRLFEKAGFSLLAHHGGARAVVRRSLRV
jgi:GNAT superfamily N-acetyltransferase